MKHKGREIGMVKSVGLIHPVSEIIDLTDSTGDRIWYYVGTPGFELKIGQLVYFDIIRRTRSCGNLELAGDSINDFKLTKKGKKK